MKLCYYDAEKPGLVLSYAWFPCWIAHNAGLFDLIHTALYEQMGERSPKDWTPAEQAKADKVVVDSICAHYPYVSGLKEHLESLGTVELDASKAPKLVVRKRKNGN